MRFILGFIFFGLLFYGIWLYFPEAFDTLVRWASNTFAFFQELFQKATGKIEKSQDYHKAIFAVLEIF
jgi:hypothetical protein